MTGGSFLPETRSNAFLEPDEAPEDVRMPPDKAARADGMKNDILLRSATGDAEEPAEEPPMISRGLDCPLSPLLPLGSGAPRLDLPRLNRKITRTRRATPATAPMTPPTTAPVLGPSSYCVDSPAEPGDEFP